VETAPIPRNLERYRHIYGIASFLPVDVDRPMVGLVVVDQFTPFERNCVPDRKAKPAHDENQSPETRAPPISRLPIHIQRNLHFFDCRQQLFELRSSERSCSPFISAKIPQPGARCLLMRPVRKNQFGGRHSRACQETSRPYLVELLAGVADERFDRAWSAIAEPGKAGLARSHPPFLISFRRRRPHTPISGKCQF